MKKDNQMLLIGAGALLVLILWDKYKTQKTISGALGLAGQQTGIPVTDSQLSTALVARPGISSTYTGAGEVTLQPGSAYLEMPVMPTPQVIPTDSSASSFTDKLSEIM